MGGWRADEKDSNGARDHLGGVLALATPGGDIVESYEYEPYGLPAIYDDDGEIVASRTSTVGNRFMFTGREWEPEGQFYHYRHRTYSPHEKRFMQRDPIGLSGGWNVYAFCGGDPVNASDPMGLDFKTDWIDPWFHLPGQMLETDVRLKTAAAASLGFFGADFLGFNQAAARFHDVAVRHSLDGQIAEAAAGDSCAASTGQAIAWGSLGVAATATTVAGAVIGAEVGVSIGFYTVGREIVKRHAQHFTRTSGGRYFSNLLSRHLARHGTRVRPTNWWKDWNTTRLVGRDGGEVAIKWTSFPPKITHSNPYYTGGASCPM